MTINVCPARIYRKQNVILQVNWKYILSRLKSAVDRDLDYQHNLHRGVWRLVTVGANTRFSKWIDGHGGGVSGDNIQI